MPCSTGTVVFYSWKPGTVIRNKERRICEQESFICGDAGGAPAPGQLFYCKTV